MRALNVLLGLVYVGLTFFSLVSRFPFLAGVDYAYVVASRSMEPSMKVGDIVLVKRVDPLQIQVGDVISYQFQDVIVSHRVIDKTEDMFQTRGDANQEPDFYWVHSSQVQGKICFVVPFSFIYSPYSYGILVFAIIVVIVRVGRNIYRASVKREKRGILDTTSFLLLAVIAITIINAFTLQSQYEKFA